MKTLLYVCFLLVTSSIFIEFGLRATGSKPGFFREYNQFELVDSLYEYKNYTTDEYGIYKFSSWVTDSVYKYLDNSKISPNTYFAEHIESEAISFAIDWGMDHLGEVLKNFNILEANIKSAIVDSTSEFEKYMARVLLNDSMSNSEKFLKNYLKHPFNKEGFRSIPFDNISTTKTKILLIGDSFTYGQSAKPMYNSFADILLARGYMVFNTGISGTDPAQYLAITEKYLPVLEPDIVVVNFCINNDLMSHYRNPEQGKPHEYLSNAGFFESYVHGKFYTLEEVYDFYKNISLIPQTNSFNKWMSKSSFLSRVWSLMHKKRLVKHPLYDDYQEGFNIPLQEKVEITLFYLNKIKSIAKDYNTPILISFIPDISNHKGKKEAPIKVEDEAISKLMENIKHVYPKHFVLDDFLDDGDFHFNNKGSIKYADFLEKEIKNLLIHE